MMIHLTSTKPSAIILKMKLSNLTPPFEEGNLIKYINTENSYEWGMWYKGNVSSVSTIRRTSLARSRLYIDPKLPLVVVTLGLSVYDHGDKIAMNQLRLNVENKPYMAMAVYQCDELYTWVSLVKKIPRRNNLQIFHEALEDSFYIYEGD